MFKSTSEAHLLLRCRNDFYSIIVAVSVSFPHFFCFFEDVNRWTSPWRDARHDVATITTNAAVFFFFCEFGHSLWLCLAWKTRAGDARPSSGGTSTRVRHFLVLLRALDNFLDIFNCARKKITVLFNSFAVKIISACYPPCNLVLNSRRYQ